MRFKLGTSVLVVTMLLSVGYFTMLGFSIDYGFGFASAFAGGDGSSGNPYQISNVTELQNMSSDRSAHYILINDIDCTNTSTWNGGLGFSPIGNDTIKDVAFQGIRFTGSFDGKGYKIINLTINRSDEYYVGLFGNVNTGNKITNVTLENVNVSAYDYVGGLIGLKSLALVSNCNITGYVNGTTRTGGLIGVNTGGTINNCSSDIYVNALGNNNGGLIAYSSGSMITNCSTFGTTFGGNMYTGGLLGYQSGGTLKQCKTYGFTNATGFYAGGLLGYNANNGDVIDCHFFGTVYSSSFDTGGLIGRNLAGSVINCTSSGLTSGTASQMGGLVGNNLGNIKDSSAWGEVTGPGNKGGLLGRNDGGTVSDSYSYQNLTGGWNIGGLIGYVTDGTITNCTAFNNVSATNNQIGGLIGDLSGGTVIDCIAYGDITGAREIGGLVGQMGSGTVKRCTAYGYINSTDNFVGGLIGEQRGGFVTQSIALGDVNGDYDTGGLIGYMENSWVTWCNAYGNTTGQDYTGGLIGAILSESTDVRIKHCNAYGIVDGINRVGGLIGRNEQGILVINCTAYGDSKGTGDYVGGLIGYQEGNSENSSAHGDVSGINYVGGLIGYNTDAFGPGGKLFNCTAMGDVIGTGDYVGGLNGYNYANTINCIALGDVSGANRVGGLFGHNTFFNITDSYHMGFVNATGDYVGGLVGYNDNIYLNDSSTFTNVTGTGQYVGGLVGWNIGNVINCTTERSVDGSNRYVGGLIGWNSDGNVTNCTIYGNITGSSNQVGGLIGFNNAYDTISGCVAYGNVDAVDEVGGLIGENSATSIISYCTAYGDATGSGYNAGGLIGVNNDGEVMNCFAYGDVTSSDFDIGGLIGYNYGPVSNSIAYGNVAGSVSGDEIGGLIGDHDGGGAVSNCTASGTVFGDQRIGGLVGNNNNQIIDNCSSSSTVTGNYMVGGLVGFNDNGEVHYSYSSGAVNCTDKTGGLVGSNQDGTITNSYSTTAVIGDTDIGGLVGENWQSTIIRSFSTGTVDGDQAVGGLAGSHSLGLINNSYSQSPVNGSDEIGGLVGNNSGPITNTYSSGYVSGITRTGGLVGVNFGTVNNSFWDNQTSGKTVSAGGTGENTSEMKKELTFTGAGWDFTNIWALQEGKTYPYYGYWYNILYYQPQLLTNSLGSVFEDSSYLANLQADFANYPTDNMLTWSFTTNTGSWLNLDQNGQLTGIPGNSDVGPVWVNVTITDSMGNISSKNLTFNVINTNDPPMITTGSLSDATEDSFYDFKINAIDIDPAGDTLTWSMTSDAPWLMINSSTGNVTGIPSNAEVGSYWVNVTVDDGNGGSHTLNFSLNVTNTNDDPVITTISIPGVATEDEFYYVNLSAFDIDPTGDTFTWSVHTDAGWLDINSSTGNLSGTPVNADVGSYWVNVTVEDGNGGTHSKNFSVAVQNVNDDPIITTTQIPDLADEDVLYFFDFDAMDIDPTGDTFTWDFISNATWLVIDSATGNLSGTPDDPDIGSFWVNVTVSDGNGGLDTINFTINVTNFNDAPIISSTDVTTATEDELYSVDYEATDADPTGDILTWNLIGAESWLNINSGTGVLSGTPENVDVGNYWVNVSVSDSKGGLTWHYFPIEVFNVNDAPEITTENVTSAMEDTLYIVQYDAIDIDPTGDTLTWALNTDADWLTFDDNNNLTGTPLNADVGSYWVNVTVSDGNGGVAWQNFTIVVQNTNDPPLITTEDVLTAEADKLYSVDYYATDIDPIGDTLTWSLGSNATWLAIDSSTGVLSGTPTKNDAGKYWVNVSVSDGNGGLDWNNFEITVPPVVIPVNMDPVITTDNVLTADVDKLYSVDYDATDDNTPLINLSWSVTTNATWLTIEASMGVLSGTPGSGDVGTFNVNVSVSDGEGGLAFTNFAITVQKPFIPTENNKPKLSKGKMDPTEGDSETKFTFSVHYTDEDDDAPETIQVVIDGLPHTMKLVSGDAGDGVYEFKTKLDEGDHTYYFTASDGTDNAEPGDTTPTTSDTAKPTPEIEKKAVADDMLLYLAILIVIIIIILLLGLAMRRKKKEEPAEEEEADAEEETEEDEEETDESEAEAFNCPECGTAIKEDMTECESCGATLEWGEEEIPDSELDEEDLDEDELPEDSEPEAEAEPDDDIEENAEEGEETDKGADAGEFECPDCGVTLGADITSCPDCGSEFED